MTTLRNRRVLRVLAIGIVSASLVPTLAGCWNGPEASTTWQAQQNSGNGSMGQVGSLKVQNATLVHAEDGRASLIVSIFNVGTEPDVLTGVTINGTAAPLPETPESTVLVPGGARSFGYGLDGQAPAGMLLVSGLDVPASSYVPVTVTFEQAGSLDLSVLTVPPVGYYEGLIPPA